MLVASPLRQLPSDVTAVSDEEGHDRSCNRRYRPGILPARETVPQTFALLRDGAAIA
jgi:hypothetical protein